MEEDLKGKVAIVTGAGCGIGYALCRAYAASGATVALNDIDGALAANAADSLNTSAGVESVHPYVVDVADVDAVRGMVNDVVAKWGRLDILIANAGLTSYGSFLDYTVEQFDRVMAVNLRGSYFCAQAAAHQMIALGTKQGRILLMSSVTGARAYLNLGAYGTTKAAIRHMARSMALELGEHGITVNAISPGAIVTERTVAEESDFETIWAAVTPTGRAGSVNDIMATARFLTSTAAEHITGQTIEVDGGWTLASPLPE